MSIYRSIVRDAATITWQRKSLWIFGIFAGLLASGSVIDVVFSELRTIQATGTLFQQLLDGSFVGYGYAAEFLLQLQKIGPTQFRIFLLIFTLLGIGLVCTSVFSQAALIHGSGTIEKRLRDIWHRVLPHFWSIFGLNLIMKVLVGIFFLLVSLPIIFSVVNKTSASVLVFIHLLIYVPLVIFLQILFTLTLIDIVESKERLLNALRNALFIFKTHWLSAIEFGLIQFFLVLFASFLFAGFFILLTIPYSYLLQASILSSSIELYFLVNGLSVVVAVALLLTFGGAVNTFQYCSWRLFYKRTVHKLHGRVSFAKLKRWLFEMS